MSRESKRGEFELIDRYFKPLVKHSPSALDLGDDAAVFCPSENSELVTTVDAMVAGVHFLAADKPADIARKLMRVNLSDLASMGARPLGYLLTTAWPDGIEECWIAEFAGGLAADQAQFDIHLFGGDTVRTPGPMTLTLTAIGEVAAGTALLRSAAKAGDGIYVSGTIGDSCLGLALLQDRLSGLSADAAEFLVSRYHLPIPRIELGLALHGVANAVIDVSDGLLADLSHILERSGVGAKVECRRVPLSVAANSAKRLFDDFWPQVLSGGDDYELLFTAAPDLVLADLQGITGLPITRIGDIIAGEGLQVLGVDGGVLPITRLGFQHL